MAKKVTYLKLGEKAVAFADINAGVILSGKEVVKVTNTQLLASKVHKALLGGHLSKADPEEYDEWVKFEAETRVNQPSGEVNFMNKVADLEAENEELKKRLAELETEPESQFSKMNTNALVKYYRDEYEVSEEDVEKFKTLELEEKRKFLEDLENS